MLIHDPLWYDLMGAAQKKKKYLKTTMLKKHLIFYINSLVVKVLD